MIEKTLFFWAMIEKIIQEVLFACTGSLPLHDSARHAFLVQAMEWNRSTLLSESFRKREVGYPCFRAAASFSVLGAFILSSQHLNKAPKGFSFASDSHCRCMPFPFSTWAASSPSYFLPRVQKPLKMGFWTEPRRKMPLLLIKWRRMDKHLEA